MTCAIGIVNPIYANSREKNTTGSAQANFDVGVKRFNMGDINGAIDSFLQAIYFSRNNYNPKAYFWLGECYRRKKEYAKGIEAFKQHLNQVMGPSPEGHVELGYLYMETNHDMQARNEFYTALGQYLSHGQRAHNALGKLEDKNGNYRQAIAHYRDALGEPPWDYLEAWMSLAECYMKAKDYPAAYQEYQAMLESKKLKYTKEDEQKMYNGMGMCLMIKGDHEGAMRKWRQCLSINPNNATAHLYLGILFDSENHISSAVDEYKQFVRLAAHDNDKVSSIKDRIEILEHKLKPPEPVYSIKPTPYMRKETEASEAVKPQLNLLNMFRSEIHRDFPTVTDSSSLRRRTRTPPH